MLNWTVLTFKLRIYVVLSSADSSTYMQNHNDTIIKTQEDFFIKYMYLSLYCKSSKRVTQGLRVTGSWRPNRNGNILTPLLWPSTLSFSFSRAAQPEAQGLTLLDDGFLYCILSASSQDPNSSGAQALSAWCGFPYRISPPTGTRTQLATVLTSVLTELYNSSMPTRSPIRSLKSHV